MGLFDKKKKGRDDFDSPVEQIDLSATDASSLGDDPVADADEAETVDLASSPASLKPATPPARPPRPGSESGARQRATLGNYGIDDAVALMRTLPSENIELVVQVVKHTLESARIDIGIIIDDATAKQQRIESRISVLRDAIAELEREIDTRRVEIGQLEADNRETTRVKERLVLAEKLTQGGRPDTVVDSQASAAGQARASRGSESPPSPPPRAKPGTSSPPPPPGASPSSVNPTPAGGSAAVGNPNHVGSGNHVVTSAVGPGGPVMGSTAVGPGGPAGSYAHKAASHTVISKK